MNIMKGVIRVPITYGYINKYEKLDKELEYLEKQLFYEKKKSRMKDLSKLIKEKRKSMKLLEPLYRRQLIERDMNNFIDRLGEGKNGL